MKPRNSWEQISDDMKREDDRQYKALKAYLTRHEPERSMSKLWTFVGGIVLLTLSLIGLYLLVGRR